MSLIGNTIFVKNSKSLLYYRKVAVTAHNYGNFFHRILPNLTPPLLDADDVRR